MKLSSMLLILLLTGCVSRQQVEGQLWSFDQLPVNLCSDHPELRNKGVYRIVNCKEFYNERECSNGQKDYELAIPYCSSRIKRMRAAEDVYVQQWLNKLGKPK